MPSFGLLIRVDHNPAQTFILPVDLNFAPIIPSSLNKADVTALANIPSREVLLAQLLGVMQAPVSAFARALAALAEKQGAGAPAAEAAAAESA